MGVHLSDFGRFVEQGSRRRLLLRFLDAVESTVGAIGALGFTGAIVIAVMVFVPDALLDNPAFFLPVVLGILGVGIGTAILVTELAGFTRMFFRRPRDLGVHLEELAPWERKKFLRSSVYRGLLREGVPEEVVVESLSAGVWSFDGIREVAAGAPPEWVASFEDGEALGFVSTGSSHGSVAA